MQTVTVFGSGTIIATYRTAVVPVIDKTRRRSHVEYRFRKTLAIELNCLQCCSRGDLAVRRTAAGELD